MSSSQVVLCVWRDPLTSFLSPRSPSPHPCLLCVRMEQQPGRVRVWSAVQKARGWWGWGGGGEGVRREGEAQLWDNTRGESELGDSGARLLQAEDPASGGGSAGRWAQTREAAVCVRACVRANSGRGTSASLKGKSEDAGELAQLLKYQGSACKWALMSARGRRP